MGSHLRFGRGGVTRVEANGCARRRRGVEPSQTNRPRRERRCGVGTRSDVSGVCRRALNRARDAASWCSRVNREAIASQGVKRTREPQLGSDPTLRCPRVRRETSEAWFGPGKAPPATARGVGTKVRRRESLTHAVHRSRVTRSWRARERREAPHTLQRELSGCVSGASITATKGAWYYAVHAYPGGW